MIRRYSVILLLLIGAALCPAVLSAQEGSQSEPSTETETRSEPDFKWHLFNSLIFFALAGYGIAKVSPAFFNARSEEIKRAIREATGLKLQAEFRSSEIDRKLATLPEAVAKIRADAQAALDREGERRRAETAEAVARIQKAVEGEIENQRQQASRQIRGRAARVAFRMAEQRLRDRAREGGNAEFLDDFVHLVQRGPAQ